MAKLILEQHEIAQLESMLVEIPYKYAQPLLQYLSGKVQKEEAATKHTSEDTAE